MRDVLEVVDTMVDDVEFMNDETKYSSENLAKLAVLGLEDVVSTFPHHFKALYRMASYFHNSPTARSPVKVGFLSLCFSFSLLLFRVPTGLDISNPAHFVL